MKNNEKKFKGGLIVMKDNRKMNSSNAMMAALSLVSDFTRDNTEELERIASSTKKSVLEKYAGIYIDNPTMENIEDFIRRYVYNELTFFPRVLDVNVQFSPAAFDTIRKDNVESGTGIVGIKVRDKVLELPFMIYGGELNPFDIIQMDGNRVPYSRENLQKIIINLDKAIDKKEREDGDANLSPYKEVSERYTPATIPGFMGDVLSIRDSQSRRHNVGGQYVTAAAYDYGFEKEAEDFLGMGLLYSKNRRPSLEECSEKALKDSENKKPTTPAPNPKPENQSEIITDLDSILKKSASINPLSDEQITVMTQIVKTALFKKDEESIEKIAKEIENENPTRKELRDFESKLSDRFKWSDASKMEHGTFIVFPEIINSENSTDIFLTTAVVISDFEPIKLHSSKYDKKPQSFSGKKFVVTSDRRIKVLNSGERFLCKQTANVFKLSNTELRNLREGDIFFAMKGNRAIPLSQLSYVRDKSLSEKYFKSLRQTAVSSIGKILHCKPFLDNESSNFNFNISTLKDTKFDFMSADEFTHAKSIEKGIDRDTVFSAYGHPNYILAADEDTKAIKINGFIENNFKTENDYEWEQKMRDANIPNEEKTASFGFNLNTVTITCSDNRQKIYNLVVEYKDTNQRLMNLRRQVFNNCNESKARAILHICKIDVSKINEGLFRARKEPRSIVAIPQTCTIEDIAKLQGGAMQNVSTDSYKQMFQRTFNPTQMAKSIAAGTAATLLIGSAATAINPTNLNTAKKVIGFVSKFAEEAKELSVSFEKYAAEHENEDYLDYAKMMTISYNFNEKLAGILNDTKNVYPSIRDISKDIVMAKPVLEKFAYDLNSLKINQTYHGNEEISPACIAGVVNNMDQLYKTALNIVSGIDMSEIKFL